MTRNDSNGQAWSRGFASAPAAGAAEELDGLRVIFDRKVGLQPANLEKRAAAPLRGRAVALGRMRSRRGGLHGRW
jgi:hypothetical protein